MKLLGMILVGILTMGSALAGVKEAVWTAEKAPACRQIQPFYWEIGDSEKSLIAGSVGKNFRGSVDRQTNVKIASASKWIFGAYILEKTNGILSAQDRQHLLMQGGFKDFNPLPCALRRTVKACAEARSNSQVSPEAVGKFYYGGGDAQALSVLHGLGRMNQQELEREVQSKLQNKFLLTYNNLALAGGLELDAARYATFLQEIIKGTYRMKDFLGQDAICTFPESCKTSLFSPAKEAWDYSYHHWVEKDVAGKVLAYSSPGSRGFYPWIDADKKYYGIISRTSTKDMAYWDSVECGRLIRKAFLSGQ